jgi:hypothetical protein
MFAGGNEENRLTWASSGSLSVTRGATTVATSSVSVLPGTLNTWYYVEAQIKIHDTAGIANVRVNGTDVITASGLDTRPSTGSALYEQLWLATQYAGATHQYDDLYISTGSGCSFQGDHVVP